MRIRRTEVSSKYLPNRSGQRAKELDELRALVDRLVANENRADNVNEDSDTFTEDTIAYADEQRAIVAKARELRRDA